MSLPDHIKSYVGHEPTSVADNSFFGEITKFGSGLMDDVGETFGVVKDAYFNSVKGYAADVAANPNTQRQYNNYADEHGNKITQPQGQVQRMPQQGFMGLSNQQLMIGGIAVIALLVLAKR